MSQRKIKVIASPAPVGPARTALIVQVGEAVEARDAFERLSALAMPVRDAYAVGRIFAALRVHPDVAAGAAARLAAYRKYGVEKDGRLIVQPEQQAGFIAEYAPVANQTMEFPSAKLSFAILESAAPTMTPAEVMALAPFFSEA